MTRLPSSSFPTPRVRPRGGFFATALAAIPAALLALGPTAGAALAQDSGSGAGNVPSFAQVAGHELGERITVHAEMVRYLEALDAASPRVRVVDQGASWEGRRLLMAIVTAPENHARLDHVRAVASRLDDPRQLDGEGSEPARLDSLLADQPLIAWLGGSIHGFELSGTEGLIKLLERLATAEDEATLEVLRETVVLIDPMLNPDGRDAFAHHNHRRIGRHPNPSPRDWVNDFTPWEAVGYRTGHYFFDTNRDWFAHTQKETLHRARTLRAWRPQVLVDAHEQGRGSEFYFDPATEPFGPFFPAYARTGFELFNDAYEKAFDGAGFEYMSGESYNYFYPGYTTSWGSYQGAIGMLFEQGSSRGLALERPDESVRTLADALEQQYTAAWAAVTTAAQNRRALLRDYVEAHRAALRDGETGIRHFLLPPVAKEGAVAEAGVAADGGDPGHRLELLQLLLRNGIEVGRLNDAVEVGGLVDRSGETIGSRTFPAGTHVVSTAQPRNRLVRVLLEPNVPLPAAFLAEARERLDRGENPRFYDTTAWSLPLLFDLPAYGTSVATSLAVQPITASTVEDALERRRSNASRTDRAGYAYLFDGRDARSVAALHRLTHGGYRAAMLLDESRLAVPGSEGLPLAAGTTIVRVGQNPESVHEAVRELADELGVAVRAVDSGAAVDGSPSLGSRRTQNARPVSVGILAEMPFHAYSFGWTWYVLEEQYGISTHVLRTGHLERLPIDHLDTLILPDLFGGTSLADTLGEGGIERLRRWVREGGNLVALGASTDFVREHIGGGALRSWAEESSEAEDTGEGEGDDAIEPRSFPVPGAIVRGRVDTRAWLAAGTDAELPVLVNSSRVFLEPEGPPNSGRRVVVRVDDERPLMSGHAWAESLERLPGAVLVYEERTGAGRVILFAEDPTFRAYHRGMHRLFLNAVLFGPNGQ